MSSPKGKNRLVFLYGSQAEFPYEEDIQIPGLTTLRKFADELVGKVMPLSEVVKAVKNYAKRFAKKPQVEVHEGYSVIELTVALGENERLVPVIKFVDEVTVNRRVTFFNHRGGIAPMFGGVPQSFQRVSNRLAGKTLILREALMSYQQVANKFGENFHVQVSEGMLSLQIYNGGMMHFLKLIHYRPV